MDEDQKVHVAVSNDVQEGFGALEWALHKWSSPSISIVILHATNHHPMDFVHTPFGKLPATSISEHKLKLLRKHEQQKIDKLLSDYLTFCGEVKAEILKVEKYDVPINKLIMDLISEHRITKLVMGMAFMKSSSGRSKNGISGSFYVQRHKPDFCELFIICGGRLVFLREENDEGIMEDDHGVMVARLKERASFKGWLGKMFADNPSNNSIPCSPTSSTNQWEDNVREIEDYFQELLASSVDEKESSPSESNMIVSQRHGVVRIKLDEARKTIKLKRKEAKDNIQRRARAERAIWLCNRRAEELEALVNKEKMHQIDIQNEVDATKEHVCEILNHVEESKNRLNLMAELQSDLSNKLHSTSLAKSHAERQVEKAVMGRAEMIREIEELRRQRDVLHRRIEFCKEKDVIRTVTGLGELSWGCKEFTSEQMRSATDGFSERLRLKLEGEWTNVYRGRINHVTVAIKMMTSADGLVQGVQNVLTNEVKLRSQIRHPHIVAMIGFCSELNCIIFEYMHNGSLQDILFSSRINSRTTNRTFCWLDHIRIASEVCSGLSFLHLAEPKPIVHGSLNPANILLDRNLVAKIHGFRLERCHDENGTSSDVRAFGHLMLQLLTGKNWAGKIGEGMVMSSETLNGVVNKMAGQWPLDLAEEFAEIGIRCFSANQGPNTDLRITTVMRALDVVSLKANLRATRECEVTNEGHRNTEDVSNTPSVFFCPIFQDIMKNPHVAADGFSYEAEAIEEWLRTGHDTSPMTNLRLKHTNLTPNHTLRSLIQDWDSKKSTQSS